MVSLWVVAGMGADLYESYCGSILATAALGAAAFVSSGNIEMQYKAVIAPMLIAAVGIVLSILGIFAVRTKEDANIRQLLKALAIGTNLSSVLIAVSTFGILYLLDLDNWFPMPKVSMVVVIMVSLWVGFRASSGMKAFSRTYQKEMSSSPRPTTTSPMTAPLRKATCNPLLSDERAALAVRAEA